MGDTNARCGEERHGKGVFFAILGSLQSATSLSPAKEKGARVAPSPCYRCPFGCNQVRPETRFQVMR